MIPRENDPARFTSSGLMGVEVFLPFSPRNVCIPWGFQANTNLLSNFPLLPMNETYGWKGAIILWDMAKPQNAPILFKLEHFFLFAFHTLNLLSHFSENSITETKSSYKISRWKLVLLQWKICIHTLFEVFKLLSSLYFRKITISEKAGFY